MALVHHEQVLEALKRSDRPLLVVGAGSGPDGYASAVGLSLVLAKLGKSPEIVANDGATPKTLAFLGAQDVKTSLEKLRRFRITLDTSKVAIDEIAQTRTADALVIEVSPKAGFWEPHDVATAADGYRFDLIVTLGASDLEACGGPYRDNPDFFYAVPVVNLDHAPGNEHYGAVNHVDLAACSVGESLAALVTQMDPDLMDADVATAFLTGMIAKTKSFKAPGLTPKTLEAAAKLVALGARRDDIVGSLYRTRSVATLRLWGRALARLKLEKEAKLAWTLIGRQDFLHAGADEADLPDVIEELIASCPDAHVAAILYESRDGSVRAVIRAERPHDAQELACVFAPTGSREEARARFTDKTISEAERILVGALMMKLT
ncbi:hypothetical protein EPO34_02835 [Patescibacteria group bacterium]|nr:MAG: hypothetical protein EPO34_02835 [Patescibacteria group bacterium]